MSLTARRLPFSQPLQAKARGRYVYSYRELVEAIREAVKRGQSTDILLAGTFSLDSTIVIPSSAPAIQIIGTGARRQLTMRAEDGDTGFRVESVDFSIRDVGYYAPGGSGVANTFIQSTAAAGDYTLKMRVDGCKVDAGRFVYRDTTGSCDIVGCEYEAGATTVMATNPLLVTATYLRIRDSLISAPSGTAVIECIGGVFAGNIAEVDTTFSSQHMVISSNHWNDVDVVLDDTTSGCSVVGNTGNGAATLTTTAGGGGNFLAVNTGFTKSIDAGDTDLGP